MINVLDHGFVALEDSMANDLSVVNSARVSNAARSISFEDRDAGLINYLMREKHGTPFEHAVFKFRVKCPIFVAREWMRHRIGSFNEMSARYVELNPEFYVPDTSNLRQRIGKPGDYKYVPHPQPRGNAHLIRMSQLLSFDYYTELISSGVAPEQARIVLPVGTYTEFYWTVNARSLMNFLELRTAENAQWEIQQYGKALEKYFENLMPATWAAWVENGRRAP